MSLPPEFRQSLMKGGSRDGHNWYHARTSPSYICVDCGNEDPGAGVTCPGVQPFVIPAWAAATPTPAAPAAPPVVEIGIGKPYSPGLGSAPHASHSWRVVALSVRPLTNGLYCNNCAFGEELGWVLSGSSVAKQRCLGTANAYVLPGWAAFPVAPPGAAPAIQYAAPFLAHMAAMGVNDVLRGPKASPETCRSCSRELCWMDASPLREDDPSLCAPCRRRKGLK